MISRKLGFPFLQAFVFGVFRILLSISFILIWRLLKGQCHEIFDTFYQKTLPGPYTVWTGINGSAKFFVYTKIFTKIREKTCVHVVVEYADMVLVWSLTTPTRCWRGHWQRRNRVSIVNDYAETREIILLWKRKKLAIKVTKNVIWYFQNC